MINLSSCVYHDGGAKIFDAKATTIEGEQAIKDYGIKYISPNVYGLYWTDFYRSKGVFATDIVKEKGNIKYSSLKEDYVQKLGLEPKFNFWNKFGGWIVGVLVVVIIIMIFKNKD
jgi:hypothetical protein